MSILSSTIKHAGIYSIASVLGKAVGFVMLPFYAHLLGDIGYGMIGMVDSSLTLLMNLFCYGMSGSLLRFYHEEEGDRKRCVVSTGLILLWVLGGVLCGGLLFAGRPMSSLLFGDPSHALIVCFAIISFFMDLTGQYAGTLLVVEQRSVVYSVLGIFRLLIGLGLNIVLIIILKLNVYGYFAAALITSIVSSVVLHVIVIRQVGWAFDRQIALKILSFELPLVPGNLLSFASSQVERVVVRFLVNLKGVGLLEMGYKFPSLLPILISEPFFRSWNTKRTEIAEESGAPEKIGKMFTVFLFLMTFSGLLLAVNMREIIQILTPPEFWLAERIAKIEIMTLIIMSAYYHVFFGMFYRKDTRSISIIKGVTAAIKIPISYALIFFFGIYGAACSGLFVSVIQLAWAFNKAQTLYRIKYEYLKVFSLVCVSILVYHLANSEAIADSKLVVGIGQFVSGYIPRLLEGTIFGTLKSGIIIRLFIEKGILIGSLITKGTLCCIVYGCIFWVYRIGFMRFENLRIAWRSIAVGMQSSVKRWF